MQGAEKRRFTVQCLLHVFTDCASCQQVGNSQKCEQVCPRAESGEIDFCNGRRSVFSLR
jgi:hypothetical protein